MSKDKKSDTPKTETAKPSTKAGQEVQAKIDVENAQGFRGIEVDPTPNENYTVAGVVAGKPTPETDPETASAARAVTNVGLTGVEAAKREKDITAANAANTRKIKGGR